jgi:hypothetical protein
MGNDKNNTAPVAAATVQGEAKKKAPVAGQATGGKVVQLKGDGCITEGCKLKPARAGFCDEHYTWFKEGLVTKDGRRPIDFEKKFFNFQQRRAKSA